MDKENIWSSMTNALFGTIQFVVKLSTNIALLPSDLVLKLGDVALVLNIGLLLMKPLIRLTKIGFMDTFSYKSLIVSILLTAVFRYVLTTLPVVNFLETMDDISSLEEVGLQDLQSPTLEPALDVDSESEPLDFMVNKPIRQNHKSNENNDLQDLLRGYNNRKRSHQPIECVDLDDDILSAINFDLP